MTTIHGEASPTSARGLTIHNLSPRGVAANSKNLNPSPRPRDGSTHSNSSGNALGIKHFTYRPSPSPGLRITPSPVTPVGREGRSESPHSHNSHVSLSRASDQQSSHGSQSGVLSPSSLPPAISSSSLPLPGSRPPPSPHSISSHQSDEDDRGPPPLERAPLEQQKQLQQLLPPVEQAAPVLRREKSPPRALNLTPLDVKIAPLKGESPSYPSGSLSRGERVKGELHQTPPYPSGSLTRGDRVEGELYHSPSYPSGSLSRGERVQQAELHHSPAYPSGSLSRGERVQAELHHSPLYPSGSLTRGERETSRLGESRERSGSGADRYASSGVLFIGERDRSGSGGRDRSNSGSGEKDRSGGGTVRGVSPNRQISTFSIPEEDKTYGYPPSLDPASADLASPSYNDSPNSPLGNVGHSHLMNSTDLLHSSQAVYQPLPAAEVPLLPTRGVPTLSSPSGNSRKSPTQVTDRIGGGFPTPTSRYATYTKLAPTHGRTQSSSTSHGDSGEGVEYDDMDTSGVRTGTLPKPGKPSRTDAKYSTPTRAVERSSFSWLPGMGGNRHAPVNKTPPQVDIRRMSVQIDQLTRAPPTPHRTGDNFDENRAKLLLRQLQEQQYEIKRRQQEETEASYNLKAELERQKQITVNLQSQQNELKLLEVRLQQEMEAWAKRKEEEEAKLKEREEATVDLEDPISQEDSKTELIDDRPQHHYNAYSHYLCCAVMLGFVMDFLVNTVLACIQEGGWWRIAVQILPLPIFLSFWYFSMFCIITAFVLVFGPVMHIKKNSQNFSSSPPKKYFKKLPKVTCEIPVYTESFSQTIRPSLENINQALDRYRQLGGAASIFVNDDGLFCLPEELRRERIEYYHAHNIAYCGRAKEGRRGKFKKASNMNFGLRMSLEMERIIKEQNCDYEEALRQIQAVPLGPNGLSDLPFHIGGDLRMGDFILLVDADTRVPVDCIAPVITEFLMNPMLGYTQHLTASMQIKFDYWENMIAQFTDCLYADVIALVCSAGAAVPLVGHNAFLRWDAIKRAQWKDPTDFGRVKMWSESNVSEDFHMSLKLQALGYTARYITYTGTEFREGVSLTCHDEIVKLRKFAYGASELIFHQFKDWWSKGVFSPEWKTFVRYKDIHWTNKIAMWSYLWTWFALAYSGPFSVITYLLFIHSKFYREFFFTPWEVQFYCILVFSALCPISYVGLKYRLGQRGIIKGLYHEFRYVAVSSIFWSSLGWHLSTAVLRHLFALPIVWGATVKEVENTNFFNELKLSWQRYAWLYLVQFFCLGIIFAHIFIPQLNGMPYALDFRILFPTVWIIGCHMLCPIALNPTLMRVQC